MGKTVGWVERSEPHHVSLVAFWWGSRSSTRPTVATLLLLLLLAAAILWPSGLAAQTFRHEGTEFAAVRTVNVPQAKLPAAVVTQFFHHGEIHDDGRNVVVLASKGQKPVPSRILQLGPGDYLPAGLPDQPGAEGL